WVMRQKRVEHATFALLPEQRRSEVERIECGQQRRELLFGPIENLRRELHQIDGVEQRQRRSPGRGKILLGKAGGQAKAIECSKAFDTHQCARNALLEFVPFIKNPGLMKNEPEQHRRINVRRHRLPRSSRSTST